MRPDVLIADQDVELAGLYRRCLTGHGLVVELAASGLECLGRAQQDTPRVLVLDRELPWGDADGVLACLREADLPLPVILTTWEGETARRLVEPPVVLCLRKFFPLQALLEAVLLVSPRRPSDDPATEEFAVATQADPGRNATRWW